MIRKFQPLSPTVADLFGRDTRVLHYCIHCSLCSKRKEHDYLEYQKKLDKEYQEIKDIKKKLTKKDGDEYKKVEEKKPEDKEEYKKDEDKDEYEEDKEEKHSSDKRRNYESDEDDVDDKKSKKDDDKDDDEEYEEKHEAPEQHHEVDMPLSCWS